MLDISDFQKNNKLNLNEIFKCNKIAGIREFGRFLKAFKV